MLLSREFRTKTGAILKEELAIFSTQNLPIAVPCAGQSRPRKPADVTTGGDAEVSVVKSLTPETK